MRSATAEYLSDEDGRPLPDNDPIHDDTDGDGQCDPDDGDDDNDGVLDAGDLEPRNPAICEDVDGDGCDDCAVGVDGFGPAPDNALANDGTDNGAPLQSNTVTVINTPPGAPAVSITPVAAAAGDALQCEITTPAPDADNDTLTYAVTWTVDGSPFAGATATTWPGDTVPAATTVGGETWICTAVANDGDADGPGSTASLVIGSANTPPEITDLTLGPATVYTDTTITATPTTGTLGFRRATLSIAPRTAAAPLMSVVMFSIPPLGLIEMPPVSKVIPFPTKAIGAALLPRGRYSRTTSRGGAPLPRATASKAPILSFCICFSSRTVHRSPSFRAIRCAMAARSGGRFSLLGVLMSSRA